MHKLLCPKLAAQNIRRDARFYLPYLLSIIGAAAAFYITVALSTSGDLPDTTRYLYLSVFMELGSMIVALFTAVFLFYTNSFLMKRRGRELGLYCILGMGKRHIAVILFFETLYLGLAGILGGIAFGMLLQRLVTTVVCNIMHSPAFFGFGLSLPGVISTVTLFGCILAASLLRNLLWIARQDPIALLRDSGAGEREPKTHWILTIIGVLTLGGGYFIAVTTPNASAAFAIYFFAVLLVIIGTYCLFTSVSIAVLKLLRKNKRYYYKSAHFIGVSGMLYRMKRNAVGLANICILSTMVLVMVSGTLSLYLGSEQVLDSHFPTDFQVEFQYNPTAEPPFSPEDESAWVTQTLRDAGAAGAEYAGGARYLRFMVQPEGGVYMARHNFTANDSIKLNFITAADYAVITGQEAPHLEPGQVWFYATQGRPAALDIRFVAQNGAPEVSWHFEIVRWLDKFPAFGDAIFDLMDSAWAVVPDVGTLMELFRQQYASYADHASALRWVGYWESHATESLQATLPKALYDARTQRENSGQGINAGLDVKYLAEYEADYYGLNGGFFFLGVFLGLILLMAMVMIIYYKQLSEGYEDRERFRIMQQVGMEQRMVRKSINSQVLSVFFMPLLVAGIHTAFDFCLMIRLLTMFGLRDVSLTLLCTLGTFGVFALVYGGVYWLTARSYYKIVRA